MRARHGHELPRSVEPYGFVPQGSEVTEIPPGSTTKIKDGIRRVALYCVEECRVVLVDIVVSRAVPESPGKSIVIRDRRIREAPDLFRVIPSRGAAHRPPMFSIAGGGIRLFGPFCRGVLSRSRAARDLLKSSATPAPRRPEISIAASQGARLCRHCHRRRVARYRRDRQHRPRRLPPPPLPPSLSLVGNLSLGGPAQRCPFDLASVICACKK